MNFEDWLMKLLHRTKHHSETVKISEVSMLDYEGLMEMSRNKAREKVEILYPFWKPKEQKEAFEMLTMKYYRQYTQL